MLEELRFKPLSIKVDLTITSSVLSADSINSIIAGLADLTGKTAQTIGFTSNILLTLTPEQADAISLKNWNF